MSEHIVSVRTYIVIFLALLALTFVTTEIAFVDLGPLNIVVALVIALCKAALVVLFFMHVRWSRPIVWLNVLAGLMWLVILLGLILTDFLSRDWIAPPRGF
ncbi:MAG: oxidase [Acidobacteria bacterium]|nr:oxidase [Acidobacteriota bacterium]